MLQKKIIHLSRVHYEMRTPRYSPVRTLPRFNVVAPSLLPQTATDLLIQSDPAAAGF